MASFDNLPALEPWVSRYSDSWISDGFSRETEMVTQALQKSMCDSPDEAVAAGFLPVFVPEEAGPVGTTGSASGQTVSWGSETETAGSMRLGVKGKAKKRRSRASKAAATTTYFAADAAHFRQMVQQVTGFKLGGPIKAGPVLKPEPHRPTHVPPPPGFLPTLDTSSFLLEQSKQPPSIGAAGSRSSLPPTPPPRMEADGNFGSGFDFDYPSDFTILESWSRKITNPPPMC